jgi:phosphoribosylpyrophosphate synthetase
MEELEIQKNEYLNHDIEAYYHDYHRAWFDTKVGYINTLKNDDGNFTNMKKEFGYTLIDAQKKLYEALEVDLPKIAKSSLVKLTICVIPRSKCKNTYNPTQLLFISTVKDYVMKNLDKFDDGVNYIERCLDTPTTHISRDYESIDIGITKRTCEISNNVQGKDILLIDDIYTKSVNIDEDAIQALYDNGANSVTFYSIGKTL